MRLLALRSRATLCRQKGARSERLFVGPAPPPRSGIRRAQLDSEMGAPISKCSCLAIDGHHPSRALVARLLGASGPPAIGWRVRPVVVYSVEGVAACRFRPHVFQEQSEAASPAFADANPAASIPSEGVVVWVLATGNHRRPSHIFGGTASPVCAPRRPDQLSLQASAAHRLPSDQDLAAHLVARSAIALATPARLTGGVLRGRPLYHQKTAEPTPRQVVEAALHHKTLLRIVEKL